MRLPSSRSDVLETDSDPGVRRAAAVRAWQPPQQIRRAQHWRFEPPRLTTPTLRLARGRGGAARWSAWRNANGYQTFMVE